MLQLALLGEADALAWQTEYPHLVYPLLAAEKLQAATQWPSRQQYVLRNSNRLTPLARRVPGLSRAQPTSKPNQTKTIN